MDEQGMYKPVIIIGAPRSGTNMLRDFLVMLDGVHTWPCDEINYIWRHGNLGFGSDEFTPAMATDKVRNYIRHQFDELAVNSCADVIVEKTCANSLRVGFVSEVIPDARYIFIVRNGVDAVASAMKRWHASLEFGYVMKKARFVPCSDLPYYAVRYIANHVRRLLSSDKRLSFWGPALQNMNELLKHYSLEEVCALQWKRCVDYAERDLAEMPEERVLRVRYEDFVAEPAKYFESIAAFVNKEAPESVMECLKANVRSSSIGKGKFDLNGVQRAKVDTLIHETMVKYGYD